MTRGWKKGEVPERVKERIRMAKNLDDLLARSAVCGSLEEFYGDEK